VASIVSCPSCAAVVVPEESGGFCPQCRTPLPDTPRTVKADAPDDVTRLSAGEAPFQPSPDVRRSTTPTTGWLSSAAGIDHGRFAPGMVLGGRYRIVGRLGKGGMGEVYRADDLKLGQAVALKFLPPDVDRDPARLTQLHTEVRMARQVSHPNVCRVYDIDEVDGTTFLSMEYVDGEDLSSLLRRIGRFPEDRALEIARQICAGLAAAHERGVIHRDFKPANVMLDGTGKVRITDFGLAGAAGEAIRAGTPAYMAPEQLSGGEVTARSDIYALGLVLYEVFTGQRALDGQNLAELINKREQSGIALPSSIVKQLDPEIERAIMRCLRPNPAERPGSALTVSAALPGGDPLAAALAAGETPSPEMVAAAGSSEALHPAVALGLVAIVVTGIIAYAAFADRRSLVARVPLEKTLDALEDRARTLAVSMGYADKPGDSARGMAFNDDVLSHVARTSQSPTRWDDMTRSGLPVMLFWYRSSPAPLVPLAPDWSPTATDPPPTVPGMKTMTFDDAGRLLEFHAVPPRTDVKREDSRAVAWPQLFAAAELPMPEFKTVESSWVPTAYADERTAWEGPFRVGSEIRVRVEAASYRGRPVFFKLVGPWTPHQDAADEDAGAPSRFWRIAAGAVVCLLFVITLALARGNLRAGRGDRRGAARISLFILGVWLIAWTVSARHYSSFGTEIGQVFNLLAYALLSAGITWLFYVALEPYVRRYYPSILISWTRALSGQLLDPRVGRDVLTGVAVGVAATVFGLALSLLPSLLGDPTPMPRMTRIEFLLGARRAVGILLAMLPNALQNAMSVAVVLVIGRALFRSTWGGVMSASVALGILVMGEAGSDYLVLSLLFTLGLAITFVGTLLYFGLLALAITFFVLAAINLAPLTLDMSRLYASGSLSVVAVVLGLAAFGFYASRRGQPLFGRLLQAD
jgi:hypothetical protein